jgi:hypothetical protein
MAQTFNTLHIFGYGETQVITDTENKKVPSSELTGVDAVVANVYAHKPADNNAGTDYHAINIFNDLFADYIPKGKDEKSFRVPYAELDAALIDAFVAEVEAIPVEEPLS